jgi:acid phosphatase type 7
MVASSDLCIVNQSIQKRMKKLLKMTMGALAALYSAGAYSQTIDRGPYLQLGTPTSVYLKWKTNTPTDSKVRYGTDPSNLTGVVNDPASVNLHEIQITGLKPSTKYYYSVENSSRVLQGTQENFFITAPVAGTTKPTRIWVIGDAGTNKAQQNQVRDAYYNYTGNVPTDVWLWLGDNAYDSGTTSEYDANVFVNHYERMFKQTVAWPAAGNHDLRSANASTQTGPYYELFTLPKNGEAGGVPSGTEAYYSFNYSNVHFICLESTTSSFRATDGAMVSWLKKDLAANTQKWTIVYFHHPPYTKGSHDSDHEVELVEMRQNIAPVLEQFKVDLVLSGHSHSYERSFLLNGHYGKESSLTDAMKVDGGNGGPSTPYSKEAEGAKGTVYAVAGVSGKVSGTTSGWPHNAMVHSTNTVYGSMVIDVRGDTLDAKFLDNNISNPTVHDQFVIVKHTKQVVTDVRNADDAKTSAIKVYPNPTKGKVHIEAVTSETSARVEVVNTIGQLVYTKDLAVENSVISEEIDLSERFSSGIYIVSVKIGEKVQNSKVLLTK